MAENNQCGEWHKETTWELPAVVQARNDSALGKAGGNEDVKRWTVYVYNTCMRIVLEIQKHFQWQNYEVSSQCQSIGHSKDNCPQANAVKIVVKLEWKRSECG